MSVVAFVADASHTRDSPDLFSGGSRDVVQDVAGVYTELFPGDLGQM